ncbi:adenylate kinase family protein [Methanobacterium formicicum]|uniref:Putative adenylate kinase n=1 Tax=Methanobacterium formicicum (strain DSM 3637 / PP1) TaxID=1204725 RepID=K2QYP3_METFP|nr:AAA family ATPase [Methanobacterium formicicum]EKF85403.1 adenylate kinase [Methanobacterium formicicum DSM 3637]
MIILLTGTPGTGKTTISHLLAEKLGCPLVDINHLVDEKHLYTGLDPEKDYKIVDMDALEGELFKVVGLQNAVDLKKDSLKDSTKSSIKASTKDSIKSSIKASTKDSIKSSIKASTKDSIKSSTKDSIKSSTKDSRNDSSKDFSINPTKNSCIIIEGHLSHYFPQADLVVVFRTEPTTLSERLRKRGWKETKIRENLEAEALDICTWEAHQIHQEKVHEVETTTITPKEVIDVILDIIDAKKSFPVGNIDFSGYLGG